jgi:hypothetical protein
MQTTLSPRRRLAGLLAALAVLITPLAAVTVMTAGPASASCTGSCLNNTDPYNTGCWDSNAYIVKQATTSYGSTLRLWYSPDCGTNWAQIYSATTAPTYLWTKLQNGTQTTHYYFTDYIGWAWSNQLYAPATNADACEQEYYTAAHQYGPVDCVGQF